MHQAFRSVRRPHSRLILPWRGLGKNSHYAAVKAGVTLPWSSGPVEGHINRLKMVKRHMFGRARLDLLSRRFVGAPDEGQAQAALPRAPTTGGGRGRVATRAILKGGGSHGLAGCLYPLYKDLYILERFKHHQKWV